jgi:hypothetical protein
MAVCRPAAAEQSRQTARKSSFCVGVMDDQVIHAYWSFEAENAAGNRCKQLATHYTSDLVAWQVGKPRYISGL